MRKIALLIFISLLFWVNNSFSAWYGNFPQTISWTSTWCNQDWNVDWGTVTFSKAPLPWTYEYDSKGVSLVWSTLYCQRWDASDPTASLWSYTNWRTKIATQTVTYWATDSWWSSLNYYLEVSTSVNAPAFSLWSTWWVADTNWSSYTYIWNNHTAYKFRVFAEDLAWNTATATSSDITKIDTQSAINYMTFATTMGAYNPPDWTKYDVTWTIFCDDDVWSWCNSSEYRIESSSFSCSSVGWTRTNSSTALISTLLDTNRISYICARTQDVVLNTYGYSPVYIIRIDKIAPNITSWWDITNSNPFNLLAVDLYPYTISIDVNWWSPIDFVEGEYEKSNNLTPWSSYHDTDLPWTQDWDISKVDNDRDKDWNTAREYTFEITKVCDDVDNCWSWNFPYNHNVYANTINGYIQTKDVQNEGLTDSSNVADNTEKNLNVELKDIYGNIIIPANWIWRNINFDFNYTNTLDLDQYNKTWNAVFIKEPEQVPTFSDTKTISGLSSWSNLVSTDWFYNFLFKAYTPTYDSSATDWRELANPNSGFIINSINIDITWSVWSRVDVPVSFSSSSFPITSIFKPLYKTSFNWEQNVYWFIEWAVQDWLLNVSVNAPWNEDLVSLKRLYLEFGEWANLASTLFNFKANLDNLLLSFVDEWYSLNSLNVSNINKLYVDPFSVTDYLLKTLLIQNSISVSSLNAKYLSSHISYRIDWYDVVYNSDVIWKTNYWDLIAEMNTTQVWLKVLWITHNEDAESLIDNQIENDIHLLWDITKSSLKRNITRNVYEIVRNLTHNSNTPSTITNLSGDTWANNTWWMKLLNDKVIYYNLIWANAWNNVVLTNWIVEWNKTIVVNWWNLYITADMVYNSNADTLGVIVLSDDAGNWWNLYIDPDVKTIVWSIYVDKSILSYRQPFWEITPDNWWTLDLLKNQLYIKGQVFSENTIGWARTDPLQCPYYLGTVCDIDTAQKYDLNYLRRYFVYDSHATFGVIDNVDEPYGWLSVSALGQGSDNYIYPVVIEYNPVVQITPPPLFDK